MTKCQREVLATLRDNGGFACLSSGWDGSPWACARYDDKRGWYVRSGPMLPTRVMNNLKASGGIQRAPGRGYGDRSFWEPSGVGTGETAMRQMAIDYLEKLAVANDLRAELGKEKT